MASSFFTIEADPTALIAALDRLGDKAEALCKDAALATARAVQREARNRVRRRTGRMYEAITYREAPRPLGGYHVFVDTMHSEHGGTRPENMAIWHEFGTWKMSAQPFMFPAVALEQGPHVQRISAAVGEAIEEQGLGE